MLRLMCNSKIHRARVTDANLDYEGSITIDEALLELAGILPYEVVRIYNITNGERFETYAITGERGKGEICLNGAAAHKVKIGDLIIIVNYQMMDEKEARKLGAFEYLQKPVEIETLMKKIKKAYKQKFESSMMAATFAEAGEFDIAKDILEADEENDEKKNDKKKK